MLGKIPFCILFSLALAAGAATCRAQEQAAVAAKPAEAGKPDAAAKPDAQDKSDAAAKPAEAGTPEAAARPDAQEKPDAPAAKQVPDRDDYNSDELLSSELQSAQSQTAQPQSGTAQNPTGQPPNPAGTPSSPAPQQQDENTKRILGIIPNFQSKDDIPQNQKPLTVREKYILEFHQTVDISAHIGNLFQAALQQASNGQPHYGQGWGPYAERFGAAEADQVTSAFFIFGFLPHILHDDPRYFRKGKGSVWSRITYSASRTVITRNDAGNSTFNIPQVAGQLLQQSISTAYYPPVDRSASGVFHNWGINLAYNSAYNILKEFYPDFLRIAFHRHAGQQSDPAPPPSTPPARPANP